MAETKEQTESVASCTPKDMDMKEAVVKSNGRKNKSKGIQRTPTKHDCSMNAKPVTPSLQISKALAIQRQRTVTLLSHNRKSHSQLDLKEARRTGNTPRLQADNATVDVMTTDTIVLTDNPFIAGMRIYNEIMLNSWRKRGECIKHLTVQVERHKQNSLNTKNQLHVYKSLFTDEQARTKELTEELNSANELIASLQQSEADLKSQLANSEKKRMNTEQQLLMKTQDHHAVNVYFKQTKNELYKLMSEHQETKNLLQMEQHKVLELEAERSKLLKSIELISNDASNEEKNLRIALSMKTNETVDLTLKLQNLMAELQNAKSKYELEFNRLSSEESKLKSELETLQSEAEILRRCLAGSIGQRVRNCWNTSVMLQRTSFGFVHWFAAAILPVMPPPVNGAPGIPSMPHCFLTIEKAMNMVKR